MVCAVFSGADVRIGHLFSLVELTRKQRTDVNVFRPFVKDRVLDELECSQIIAIDCGSDFDV